MYLSKQQALCSSHLKADPDEEGKTIMFFITEEAKETTLDLSQGTVTLL